MRYSTRDNHPKLRDCTMQFIFTEDTKYNLSRGSFEFMITRYGYKNETLEDIDREYSNPRKHPTRPPIGFYDEVEEARKDAVYYRTEKSKWDEYRNKVKPLIFKAEIDIHDRSSIEDTITMLNDALKRLDEIEKTKPKSNFEDILRNGYMYF